MPKELSTQEKLNHIQTEGGSVTYNFENGSKLKQDINKHVFFNEKGRRRNDDDVLNIFKGICHDLGAISFQL
jgi:hypothetical protein